MAEGQGKNRRRSGGGRGIISGIVRQMVARPPIAPHPLGLPGGQKPPGVYLQQSGRGDLLMQQKLVMTPKISFKTDEEIAQAIEQALVFDPDEVG